MSKEYAATSARLVSLLRFRNIDQPVGVLQDVPVQDAEEKIRSILQRYRDKDRDRAESHELVYGYVMVGRERDGLLVVCAFTIEVVHAQPVRLKIREITKRFTRARF